MNNIVVAAVTALILSSGVAFAAGEHEPFPFSVPGQTSVITKPVNGGPVGYKAPATPLAVNSGLQFVTPASSEAGVQTANSLPEGFSAVPGEQARTTLVDDTAARAAAMHLADEKLKSGGRRG